MYHPYLYVILCLTPPQWPYILGQKCMHKQCRPRQSGSTIFDVPPIFICYIVCYTTTMALHIRTEVYAQTVQTQTIRVYNMMYHPYLYVILCVTPPQWPYILGQKCMHKQRRPKQSGSALFDVPPIFICNIVSYTTTMGPHIKTEVYAQTAQTQTIRACTI